MRRIMVLALGLSVTLSSGVLPASAASESSMAPVKVGTVLGQVLATDITAWINGKPIPSMNINGYTAVAAEDLRHYGFQVGWVPGERKVVLSYRPEKPVDPLPLMPSEAETGCPIGKVLATDITAYYGEVRIPSYNIGGRTAIVLNDLSSFGQVEWKAEERTISFKPTIVEQGGDADPVEGHLQVREGDTLEIKGIKVTEGPVLYEDGEIGFVQEGNPYLDVNWLARQLGYKLEMVDGGAYTISNGSYSFRVMAGKSVSSLNWFGVPVGASELLAEPVWFDDKLHMRETDLEALFGYQSKWDPETRLLDLRYIHYTVTDYGIPEVWNQYEFRLQGTAYMNGVGGALPMLRLTRVDDSGQYSGGSSSLGLEEEGVSGGLPKYSLSSNISTDLGRNEIKVLMTSGNRLLYAKERVYDLHMADMDPIIPYPDSPGVDWNRIRLEAPADSYTLTGDSFLELRGTVEKAIGSGLDYIVEKQDHETGAYREVGKGRVLFSGNSYSGKAELSKGEGLYRITLWSDRSTPRGNNPIPIAKLYARYTPR